MKKILLSVVLALLLSGVKTAKPTPVLLKYSLIQNQISYSTYKSDSKRFSIKYPSNWDLSENIRYAGGKVDVVIMEPENGMNFRTNLNIIIKYDNLPDKEAYRRAQSSMMQDYFPDFSIISNEYVTIGGCRAIKLTASMTMQGYPVMQNQYVVAKNGRSLIVTFTTSKSRYPTEKSTINTIINSLNII